jgi:hypothetical protein
MLNAQVHRKGRGRATIWNLGADGQPRGFGTVSVPRDMREQVYLLARLLDKKDSRLLEILEELGH